MDKFRKQIPVAFVDIEKFMGTWFVIASIPTIFEKNAVNSTEIYNWNPEKERVEIDFRFNVKSPTGPLRKIPQLGFIHNKGQNSEWRVQPLWPLRLATLIIYLAEDYSVTVVGRPGLENIWVMARAKRIETKAFDQIVSDIKSYGYDMGKLILTPQF